MEKVETKSPHFSCLNLALKKQIFLIFFLDFLFSKQLVFDFTSSLHQKKKMVTPFLWDILFMLWLTVI